MSLQAALQNEVFRWYVLFVGSLLIIGGLIVGLLRWRFGSKLDHAWKSYQSWLVMIPIIVIVMTLGREVFILFVAALSLRGFWEFATATGLRRDRGLMIVVCLGITALGTAALLNGYGHFTAVPIFGCMAIFLVPVMRNQSSGQVRQVSLALLGFVYIGWLFSHLALFANTKHAFGYLSFLLFSVEFCDIAAYVVGRTLGRHVLRSGISPKKTWEGSLGALAVAMALPWLLWFSFPHFGPTELILTGLIIGVGGQLGDLAISVIKRDVEIKDMGDVIPGHGGILDRIDSLIFVAPLFWQLVRFFHETPTT